MPQVDRTDAQSLNLSINRYNEYVDEMRRYNDCLRDEAARDMQAVVDGQQAAMSSAMEEADAVRPRGTQAQ